MAEITQIYTAVEGDNFDLIAHKIGNISLEDLIALNGDLTGQVEIDIGAKVLIPKPSKKIVKNELWN